MVKEKLDTGRSEIPRMRDRYDDRIWIYALKGTVALNTLTGTMGTLRPPE